MTSAEEHLKVIRDELAEERKAEARENARGNDPVIRLEHVNLTFDRPILEDVSLEARKGETLMVAGESGSGKSTILTSWATKTSNPRRRRASNRALANGLSSSTTRMRWGA